jgi:hypothetical protein
MRKLRSSKNNHWTNQEFAHARLHISRTRYRRSGKLRAAARLFPMINSACFKSPFFLLPFRTAPLQFLTPLTAVWRNEKECKLAEEGRMLKRLDVVVEKCVCATVKETALSFLITDNKSLQRHLSQAGPCIQCDSQIGFFLSLFFTISYSISLSFPHLYGNGASFPRFCNSVRFINKTPLFLAYPSKKVPYLNLITFLSYTL